MDSATDQQTGGEPYPGLLSVGQYDFRSLAQRRDTPLIRALARLAGDTDSDDDHTVAAFGNFAPDSPTRTRDPRMALPEA
jgi:hypothetical protein